jgi:hypothetical protein
VKLTAGTITDEQIRELRDGLRDTPADRVVKHDCNLALLDLCGGYAPKHERALITREHRAARARCAEILNARSTR